MHRCFAIFLFTLIFLDGALCQDRGVIQCEAGSSASVPAWTEPGSAYVVEQLSCGQMVSVTGLERGYVRIRIDARSGYVNARYVRLLPAEGDQDRRISALEAQVNALQKQTAASSPPPETSAQAAPVKSEMPGRSGIPRGVDHRKSHSYELQELPRVEIFGGYSFVSLDEGVGSMDGWNASILGNLNSTFGLKGEVSGLYAKSSFYHDLRFSGYSLMGGPQITGRTGPASVFAHALFGVEHLGANVPYEGLRVGASTNAFAMALGGGLDWHHGAWGIRLLQLDYFPWKALGGTAHNVRISGGIVFRLH